MFAYLYDVDTHGIGALVTHKPFTLRGATPGQPAAVDFELERTNWNVQAGHHLALVVDTVDARYQAVNEPGAKLTFSSPAADPSWLQVPPNSPHRSRASSSTHYRWRARPRFLVRRS